MGLLTNIILVLGVIYAVIAMVSERGTDEKFEGDKLEYRS